MDRKLDKILSFLTKRIQSDSSGASTSTEEETGGDSNDPEMSRFVTVSIGLTMLCTTNHTGTCTV